MDRKQCDRCGKLIEEGKIGFIRTNEIRTEAVLHPLRNSVFSIVYDLCPACKDLFLGFMEGEAIPPCKTKDAGS